MFWCRYCIRYHPVGALNITMGYSSKNNPAQILIAKLFKMHTNALSRNAKSYVLYYKDVLDIDASFGGALCKKTAGLVNSSIKITIRLLPSKVMELNLIQQIYFLLLFKMGQGICLRNDFDFIDFD
jgi:hypothetical protein